MLFPEDVMVTLPKQQTGKVIFFTSLVINIFVLDWIVLTRLPSKTYLISETENSKTLDKVSPTPVNLPTEIPTNTPTPEYIHKNQETVTTTVTREIYIPVGSGSTKSSSWDALEGIEVNIDTNKYGYIKEAYFQAALRIPTANGEVRAKLYNETDKHDVWFSEVSSAGATGIIKEAKITVDKGAKLYRVYLKSTLEAEAVLDLARIKLIVEE